MFSPKTRCAFDAHVCIVEALRQFHDAPADLKPFFIFRDHLIKNCQPAQNGEQLGNLTGAVAQFQGALISLFNFFGKASGRQQRPRQRGLQHDFLLGALRCGDRGRKDLQQIAGQLDGGMIPTACIMEHQQAIGELAKLFKIPFGSPISPGSLNIFEVSSQFSQSRLALRRRSNAPVETG